MSVIIPVFNASAFLAQGLPALVSECREGFEFEVIVVDDGSSDDSASVSESFGARVHQMAQNGGPARARNAGAAQARGEYLLFVDADVRIHPGALSRVIEFLDEHPSVAAVFGSYDSRPRVRGLLTEYKNLLHHFVHQTGQQQASTFWTGCGAIRREVFRQMGGFDESGYPRCIEDIELGYRLRAAGYEIVLDPGLQCTHLKRWTICEWIRTDVFCRAIPWADLNFKRGVDPDDLNISKSQKLSVLLTAVGVMLAATVPVSSWAVAGAVLALLVVVALNHRLFRFFWRARGSWFALGCIPLHMLYFLYSGISYAYVWIAFKLGVRVVDGNTRGY
ncbi:MAG: glycosyltransferase [Acidobacteriota bacterium]|nr:MAG: glycosyltransferase [Acidobacteriota bacterium]